MNALADISKLLADAQLASSAASRLELTTDPAAMFRRAAELRDRADTVADETRPAVRDLLQRRGVLVGVTSQGLVEVVFGDGSPLIAMHVANLSLDLS